MFRPGERVGGYEIVADLRAGGMATLYLAKRVGPAGFSRYVAIKVVHTHLAKDPAFIRMFLDEARLSSRIEHPNVVHVEELGQEGSTYYLVMEYVNGCHLGQLLRQLGKMQRRLTVELATAITIRVLEGLHAAHQTTSEDGEALGVVHRDISPQNILLSFRGPVKLIDFGIAKARGRAAQTASRSLKGKLRYMAPEQAYGLRVDRRTDLYALGIVLWEMLTMRRMFPHGDDFELLERVRSPDVLPPSEYHDAVPEALDAIVMRALSPRREGRPATAQAMRRELTEAIPGATMIDDPTIGDFLELVMKDAIRARRAQLPESVSQVLTQAEKHSSDPVGRSKTPEQQLEELTSASVDVEIDLVDEPTPEDAAGAPPPRARLTDRGRNAIVVVAAAAALGLGATFFGRAGTGGPEALGPTAPAEEAVNAPDAGNGPTLLGAIAQPEAAEERSVPEVGSPAAAGDAAQGRRETSHRDDDPEAERRRLRRAREQRLAATKHRSTKRDTTESTERRPDGEGEPRDEVPFAQNPGF